MSYLTFSRRIASYLIKKTGLPGEKEVILAYASEVLILNLLNVGIALLIGFLLGVVKGTVICLITVCIIRIFAGGAHSNSPWRCAVITGLLFPAMAFLAYRLTVLGQPFADILLLISIIVSLLVTVFFAPVSTPAAPIISEDRRKKLKFLSISALVLLTTIAILMRIYNLLNINTQLCLGLGLLWITFILTPAGYKLFTLFDSVNIKKERRECN